jgi:hypothetical protein
MLWSILLITLVVDPDVLKRVLKHGAQAVSESEPDLTRPLLHLPAPLITEARYLAGASRSASASLEFWGSADSGAPPRTRATAPSWTPTPLSRSWALFLVRRRSETR